MALNMENFKIEKANGVATVSYEDENAFYEGTELSKKQIKEVFEHMHEYVEEAATVTAEKATQIMSEDKEINEVHFTLPYGVSKRGSVNIKAKREVTFPGMNGGDPVTRSDLKVIVKDPHSKVGKTKLKDLQKKMSEELLS